MTRIYSSERYSDAHSFITCSITNQDCLHLVFHAYCFKAVISRIDIDIHTIDGQIMCGLECISFLNRVHRILTDGLSCDDASILEFD